MRTIRNKTTSLVLVLLCLITLIAPAVQAQAANTIGTEESLRCAVNSSMPIRTCVLAAEGNHSVVYVMKDDANAAEFLPNGTTPSANAKKIADEFDVIYGMLSNPSSKFYTGLPQHTPGMDKVVIILMAIDTSGRFVATNVTSVNALSRKDDMVIYMNIAGNGSGLKTNPTRFFTTMIHEYQHYINHSAFLRSPAPKERMEIWLDEGLAGLAEMNYTKSYGTLFGEHLFPPGISMLPNDRDWHTGENNTMFPEYIRSLYASSKMMALTLQEAGVNMANLVSDNSNYGANSTLLRIAKAYTGQATNEGYDKAFTDFILKYVVSNHPGGQPGFFTYGTTETYNSIVGWWNSTHRALTEGVAQRFSLAVGPFMPEYNAWWYTGRTPIDKNAITVQVTDNTTYPSNVTPTRYFIVYAKDGGTNRVYEELPRNTTTTIETGQNVSFWIVPITYFTRNTNASVVFNSTVVGELTTAPINPPASLRATTVSGTEINLSWGEPSTVGGRLAAQSYQVFRDGVMIGTTTNRTYSDTGLTTATEYSYYVRAVNGTTVSPNSNTVTATSGGRLLPPRSLSFSGDSNGIRLRWSAPSTTGGNLQATSYDLYRDGTLIWTGTETSYTDEAVDPGGTYIYTVRAQNGTAVSQLSDPVTATARGLNPPRTLRVSTSNNTEIRLSWTAPSGSGAMSPTSYDVYRNGVLIQNVTTTSYSDTDTEGGVEYTYHIKARRGAASSESSNEVTVTSRAQINAARSFSATLADNNTRVSLRWSAPSTSSSTLPATGYSIYKNGTLLTNVTGTSYNDDAVEPGGSYTYYVVATNGDKSSAPTASITVLVPSGLEPREPEQRENEPRENEQWEIEPRGEASFSDVRAADWFYNDVRMAYESGLIDGKSPTNFAPNDNLTYAEAIKLAACMHQLYTEGAVTLTNSQTGQWYQSYVDYAKRNGIISADYSWNTAATRAGYMEIFANALPDSAYAEINTVPSNSIPDVRMSHPNSDEIYKLYRAGILQGFNDARDCYPNENIARSQVAAVLTRMMNESTRIRFNMP